jgi:hypothetical protein
MTKRKSRYIAMMPRYEIEGRNLPEISPEAKADRERRSNLEHPTFTALFCGDPLPGYSALDQRGAECKS